MTVLHSRDVLNWSSSPEDDVPALQGNDGLSNLYSGRIPLGERLFDRNLCRGHENVRKLLTTRRLHSMIIEVLTAHGSKGMTFLASILHQPC